MRRPGLTGPTLRLGLSLLVCFRGEDSAEDVPGPLRVGRDLEAHGDPDLPAQSPTGVTRFTRGR